ncbi:MAG: hypothetical protein ACRC8S_17105 [Fimbriiglobus sp.]
MREIRTDTEVVAHAVSDAINLFMKELEDRGLVDREACEIGFDIDGDLLRLKYEIAASVAAQWEVSWRQDDLYSTTQQRS